MVGAAPECPPERPRSDVSMRKEHVPMRKGDVSIGKALADGMQQGVVANVARLTIHSFHSSPF
jgi:hypothetical protein